MSDKNNEIEPAGKRSPLPRGIKKPNDFAIWMKRRELTVETVAKWLNVTPSAIYGYRRGNRPPSRRIAVEIKKLTDGEVKPESWE